MAPNSQTKVDFFGYCTFRSDEKSLLNNSIDDWCLHWLLRPGFCSFKMMGTNRSRNIILRK